MSYIRSAISKFLKTQPPARIIALGFALLILCGAALLMLPFFLLAMYEKNGQPLEKIVRNIVQVCFLRPKQRPYATNNFYAVLERQDNLDREVYRIVHPHKTHPRRTQADRGRHRKSEAAG